MKTLIAAAAALSAVVLTAPAAYAQRGDHDRGRHERNDNDRGRRGGDHDGRRDWNRGSDRSLLGARPRGDVSREAWANRYGGDHGDDGRRDRGDDGDRGHNDNDGRRDWNRGGGDHGRDWGRDDHGRDRGDWNRGGDDRRDWGRNDHGRDRGDWNRGGHDGRRDWASNDRDRRGGRDWGRDGRRDWRDDDHHRRDWDRSRHDSRYRPYWNTHRDFNRPRYRDWRHVRHGYYFDDGYARIVGGYYGRRYYWWSYSGWHRPYRRWAVGYVIPAWLYWEPVPWDLYYRLPPAPYGCRYIYADGDVLLVAIATGIIIDALLYY